MTDRAVKSRCAGVVRSFGEMKWPVLVVLLLFALSNLFVYWFVRQERFIYYWDLSGYWRLYQDVGQLWRDGPLGAFRTLFHSIRHDDYNLFPVIFLVPFNYIFGDGRLGYILSVTNVYAIPAGILFGGLIVKILSPLDRKVASTVFCFSIVGFALSSELWNPILYGYIGVAGLVVIYALLLVHLRSPFDKQSYGNLVAIGLLLSTLVFLRRWYAYWAASFLIALTVERGVSLLSKQGSKALSYWPTIRNVLIICGSFAISFFFIGGRTAQRMIVTNYSDIYSAYRFSLSLIEDLPIVVSRFGLLWTFLFLAGGIQGIASSRTRSISVVLILQLVIIYVMFSRTQNFGDHHLYLLFSNMAVFTGLFLSNTFLWLKSKIFQRLFLSVCFGFLFLDCAVVFGPSGWAYSQKAKLLLSEKRHYPLVRGDLDSIHELFNVLEKLESEAEGDIYVLASSHLLNDHILRNGISANRQALKERILPAFHVDKIYGFPFQFLKAKYVVVVDPVQYHLRPEDQRVIGVLASMILTQSRIGTIYRKLPYAFSLETGAQVYIYLKTRPFGKADLRELSDTFKSFYPNLEGFSKIENYVCDLLAKKEIGDRVGAISCDKDAVYIHPGASKPSIVRFKLLKEYERMEMVLGFRDPDRIVSACGKEGGEVNVILACDGRSVFSEYVTRGQALKQLVDVRGVDTVEVIVEKGLHGPDCDWFVLRDILLR